MASDRFARMKGLLLAATDLGEAERAALLDKACKNDPDLRREVESILAHENSVIGMMKTGSTAPAKKESHPASIGPYRIEGILGVGGMGVVYCAWDGRLERQVALKVLPEAVAVDPSRVERFEREAKLLAALNHPNIATVYTLEEFEGARFITMELVAGKTLAEQLEAGPLELGDGLSYCRQIAKALEAAHKRGVIHRDLKPTNVKITPEGGVKVLDLGIAKALGAGRRAGREELTISGEMLGTPGYMSPEQVRGHPADQRADIWAFGCVLYECLTGRRAFDGSTVSEVLAAALEREPQWEALPEATPEAVQELLRRCLAKDETERLGEISEARHTIEGELAWHEVGPVQVTGQPGRAAPRSNLPVQLTSFVGRAREAAEIKELLAGTRLLTLTGVGGCGKTRLALHVAGEVSEAHPDGVWLVELAPLTDPGLVPQTVARTLAVRDQRGRTVTEVLIDRLREKRAFLIFDNCEHLLGACAELADTLLRACPELRIVASSREGLGISGETTYHVPSLLLPEAGEKLGIDELGRVDAVQLFVERARAALPEFALTAENIPAVAEICRRLDGIPLAIELAAARIKVMSAEEIAERLDDRFRLLGGGSRTALPRHQTLRSLIDWSYEQLTEAEGMLLRRLSVFGGSWTVRAAEAVCSGDGVDEWEVLDLLSHLVDKSLVEMDAKSRVHSGKTRYRLLETVRQYSRERLIQAGEVVAVRGRHLDFHLSLAEEAAPHLRSAEQLEWLDRLDLEHDNLRVALDMSTSAGSAPDLGARLVDALSYYWVLRGFWTEGRGYCTGLLSRPEGGEAARAGILSCAGTMATALGNLGEAKELQEKSLGLSRSSGARDRVAAALHRLGSIAGHEGDLERSRRLTEEALALYRDLGDKHGTLVCLVNLAALDGMEGGSERGIRSANEILALAREVGDRVPMSLTLQNLGSWHRDACDFAKARFASEEGLRLARELRMPDRECFLLNNLACVAHDQGRLHDCRTLSEEVVAKARELGSRDLIARGVHHLALVAENTGNESAAEALYAEELAIRREMGARVFIANDLSDAAVRAARRHEVDRARSCIEEALGILDGIGGSVFQAPYSVGLSYALARLGDHERARRLLVESGALRLDSASLLVTEALEVHAVVAIGVGEPERAARLYGATDALRERMDAPRLPVFQQDYEKDAQALRATLGDERLAQALAEGRALDRKQAITYASEDTEREGPRAE